MDISVAKQPESITPMIPVGNAVKIKVGRIASVVPWVATISGSSTRPAKAICTSARQKKKQIIEFMTAARRAILKLLAENTRCQM